jgi:AcrR family transcriptional regulator
LRERILTAFGARARVSGFKAVVMAEVAADLGISTKTLYQQFPSKAELVMALVVDLSNRREAAQKERLAATRDPVARLHAAAQSWLTHDGRFRREHWEELRRDYPDAHRIMADALRRGIARSREWLQSALRPDFPEALALGFLMALLRQASDPAFCDSAGVTRAEAMRQAIDLWAGSALRPRSTLREARR